MATYNPPTENLPIFDPLVFLTGDEALTYNDAVKKFLKYPNAQGEETLQAINVNGVAEFNSTAEFNSFTTFNDTITIADGAENSTIDMNGTTDTLTTLNNVNNGSMVFAVKDGSGIQKNIFTGNASSVNVNGNTQAVFSGGTTSYTIQSSGTTTNAPFTTNLASPSNTGLVLNNAGIVQSGTVVNGLQNISMNANQDIDISTAGSINLNDYGGNVQDYIAITTDPTTKDFTIVSNTLASPVEVIAFTPSTNSLTTGATMPSATDSSDKIPNTAWVQNAISASVSQSNSAEHYVQANNSAYPFGVSLGTIPLIKFEGAGNYASAYGMNYYDAITFDFVFNLTIAGNNTGSSDSGGVILNNNQVSGTMYVYPTAFTTTFGITSSPYFYLNGGIGSSTNGSSTYYNCPITTYTPNGRPFWVNNLLNQANVLNVMPCATFVNSGDAYLMFQFAPIGWNGTTQCIWNLSLTLRNSGKVPASKITTQNFNINNI